MKYQKLAFVALVASTAALANIAVPNVASCVGDGVEFNYTESSFAGAPTASYAGPGLIGTQPEKVSLNGKDSVITSKSPLGILATAKRLVVVPDLGTLDVSLILSEVNFKEGEQSAKIESVLLLTKKKTSFAGPQGVEGALIATTAIPVTCDVSVVQF